MNRHIFCFGYGYTCRTLGKALKKQATPWTISGTTRDDDRYTALKNDGVKPYLFERDHPLADPAYSLRDVTHLLISTPPDDDGDPAFLAHEEDLAQLKNLEWIGYFSTTGVYGDREGRWVDETSDIRPTSRRGARRAKAEEQWLSLYHQHGLPVHIFRLAGIYGPGRSALDSVRAGMGRRIYKDGHVFGRIHVDDIVGGLLKSFQTPTPGEIYNLCDDHPAASHDVIGYACELLGMEPPPLIDFEDANLAPMTRSFYSENRRVRNDKIKRDLEMEFKYPDYKTGLQGCLRADNKKETARATDTQGTQENGQDGKAIPAVFKR